MTQETLAIVLAEELGDGNNFSYLLQANIDALGVNKLKYGGYTPEFEPIAEYYEIHLKALMDAIKIMEADAMSKGRLVNW